MILVVMAAGMGSRFGGMKQLTSVGPNGEFLIDYSIYDAIQAGVTKVIFVIKEENLDLFRDSIGKRIESKILVRYVFQKLDDLPVDGISVKRDKPWGTGQALLSCRDIIDDSFMVINADDFYGRDAFLKLGEFLKKKKRLKKKDLKKHYAMVGYFLKNTLSENGLVSRGVCEIDDGYLMKVIEKSKVGYLDGKLISVDGDHYEELDDQAMVSVNLFGFTPEIFSDASDYFVDFLKKDLDLEHHEFYLSTIIQKSIDSGKADMVVLNTNSQFNGMTYLADLEQLKKYIKKLISDGVYPSDLWGDSNE